MTRALIAVLCGVLWSAPAAAQATSRPVTIDDVIQLTRSGISDETIVTFLDTREIGFVPDAPTIARLRAAGVSEDVIRYLLERTAVVQAPVYRPPVASAPRYGYPLAYYSPGSSAAGLGFSVGFPILPHWLHDHHVTHLIVRPFAAPLHSNGGGHGMMRVGLSPRSAGHFSNAGHIGVVHRPTVHSVAPAGGAIHTTSVGHGSVGRAGGHSGRVGGGHAGGHGGGHAGGHGGRRGGR